MTNPKIVASTDLFDNGLEKPAAPHHVRRRSHRQYPHMYRRGFFGASIFVMSFIASANAQSVVITQSTPTDGQVFRGAVVDRGGAPTAVNTTNFIDIRVLDYATATTIPFETSVLGVAQLPGAPVMAPGVGARAGVLEDLSLTSNLQNPSVGSGILFQFTGSDGAPTTLTNGPGADFILFELSPPPGVTPPSGGPTVLGGDPFQLVDPATGETASFFAGDFEQFGGPGFTGLSSFFTAAGPSITSLDDLENGDLAFVITIPGINLYGTAVDLSSLNIAEGDAVSTLQIQSIAATGFGPDLGFIAGLPSLTDAPGAGPALGIVDGVLQLGAFGPFTSDFAVSVLSPQAGAPAFTAISAPLFTTINVDSTNPLIQSVVGDFLLDGSVPLSKQSTIVADHVTDLIEVGIDGAVFGALSDISALGADNLSTNLSQLSPEPFTSAPAVVAIEQVDIHARQLRDRYTAARAHRRNGATAGDGLQFWGDGFGSLQNHEGDASAGISGFDPDLIGLTAGADVWVRDNLLVGLTGTYNDAETNFDKVDATIEGRSGLFSAYAMATHGIGWAALSGGYGFGDNETRRTITGASRTETAFSEQDVRQIFGEAEIGATFAYGTITMEPRLGAVFANIDRGELIESGADGFNLIIADTPDVNVLFLEPQVRLSTAMNFYGVKFSPEANIGYRYDVLNEATTATARFAGAPLGPELTLTGADLERTAVTAGAGVNIDLGSRFALTGRYDGLFGNLFDTHEISLTAIVRF